jgi:hypothetical protein
MSKPINPYTTLKDKFRKFADACEYRKPKTMWMYPKEKLGNNWSLKDLFERVAAADQIGFDVGLFATDEGLVVKYLKKIPERPWEIS